MSKDQGGAGAAPRWDTWVNCFLLLLFIFFFFNLWETLHDRMFVERVASTTGLQRITEFHAEYVAIGVVGILVILAIWTARRPRQMWSFLSSMHLAIITMSAVLLGTVAGTLVFQNSQPAKYVEFYSEPMFAIFKALHFTNIFSSWWFIAFTVLLCINLVSCTIQRKAWRLPLLGVLLTHIGIVVVVLGGFVGDLFKVEGGITLTDGQSTDYVASKNYMRYEENRMEKLYPVDIPEQARLPIGFTLQLDKFEVLTYKDPYIVEANELHRRTDTNEAVLIPEQTIKFDDQRPLTLEGGRGVLRIEKYYTHFRRAKEISESPEGKPVAEVVFYPQDHIPISQTLTEESLSLPVEGDTFNLRFTWARPADDQLRALGIISDVPVFKLTAFGMDGEHAKLELKPGETAQLKGTALSVKLLNFFSDLKAVKEGEKLVFSNASDKMLNPAVEVEVSGGDLPPETYILPSRIEQLMHGDLAIEGRKLMGLMNRSGLMLRYDPSIEVLLVGGERKLYIFSPGQAEDVVDLNPEGTFTPEFSGYGIHFGRMFANGVVSENEAYLDDSPVDNYAVELVLKKNGEEKRAVIEESDRIPDSEVISDGRYGLKVDDKWFVTLRIRADYINDYRSHVAVVRNGERQREQVVRVNEPLIENGFYFYQNAYGRDGAGFFTYLEVSNDPGLPLVYLGLLMMIAGIIFTFYIKPRLQRGAKKENDYVE
jgi:hypothetical protein